MAYININKDVDLIKNKIMFNMTKRQITGFVTAGILGIGLYFLTSNDIGVNLAVILMSSVMFPILFITFKEEENIFYEKYLEYIFLHSMYNARKRENTTVEEKKKQNPVMMLIKDLYNLDNPKITVKDTFRGIEINENGILFYEKNKKKYYNKMIEFENTNYQLLSDFEREKTYNKFIRLLNFFDNSVKIQFYYPNIRNKNNINEVIKIDDEKEEYNHLKREFRSIINSQMKKNSNRIAQKRYLIFTIEAEEEKTATLKLERLENDLLNVFRQMNVTAKAVSKKQRLELLSENLSNKNTSIREIEDIYPEEIFITKNYLKINNKLSSVSYIRVLASELSDEFLTELLYMQNIHNVSIHIEAQEQAEAIKNIKGKNSDVQKMIVDEQKRALQSGYDMDLISSDLELYRDEMKELVHSLQKKDEKVFKVTFTIMNYGNSKSGLDNSIEQVKSLLTKHNLGFKKLSYNQESGLINSLPLGINELDFHRKLITTSLASLIPFSTKELFMNENKAMYYGLNAVDEKVILVDRTKLKNPNGLILGKPGAGKSFAAKREIINSLLATNDDVIICDPEGEYIPLVKEFGGTVIDISVNSKQYVNPLDITFKESDDKIEVMKDKSDFIISFLELVVKDRGLSAEEISVIDETLPQLYAKYFDNPVAKNMPILSDLHNILQGKGNIGQKLSRELKIYVTGSLNVFNNRTNIDINNALVCFDIKKLKQNLKKIGMLIVQDAVWNKVSRNRDNKKSTRYYIDEFHLLLKDVQTAQYSVEIWKRFRKWGGVPTGITQNVKDLLASAEVENIFDTTDFILMLAQQGTDLEILSEKLNISENQQAYVKNTNEGEGLLFYGDTIIPFKDKFPKNTVLYKKMTTKLEEVEGA